MTMYKGHQKQLAMRILCALFVSTCAAAGGQHAWAANGAVNGNEVMIAGSNASAFEHVTQAIEENATAFGEGTIAKGEKCYSFWK